MTEKIKGLEVDLEIQENKQTPTKNSRRFEQLFE